MSTRWDQIEDRLDEYESQIDSVYRLYHIPVLAALMIFMFWVRVRHYGRHIGPDGEPLFRGNDPYYHYRTTNYVIANFPFNMPFDPWTGFDTGTSVGQFGTILDQMVATAALIIGLGSPSESTIVMTMLMSGPVFAVLCAIPLYFIGKRLGGRFGGIVAVLILALTPGQFLSRSVAGYYGHHVTEVLFTLIALSVGMVMLTVAQREKPIYELFSTRDFDEVRESMLWAAAFGISLTVAVLNWPPAIFLAGVFGLFLFIQLSLEFARGHSPDHVGIPSAFSMVVLTVTAVPFIETFDLSATTISPVHVLLPLAVAVGTLFMIGVARKWEVLEDVPRVAYPAGIAGAGVLLVGIVAVVLPDLFDFFVSQAERVASLGASDTQATIGEAQAPPNPIDFFYGNYGLAIFTALGGAAILTYRVFSSVRARAEYLLVLTFSGVVLLFALTQIRFDYYFVIAVASMNAVLIGWIYNFVDLDNVREDFTTVKPYQILIVVAIIFVIAGPLVVTGATVAAANSASQPGEVQQWQGSLDWMSDNTPEVGAYGSGELRDDALELYGTYDRTDDFQYEDGDYGVLAWWDYGHFITSVGERIPVANPFQQHATESADFLLADDEQEALEILDEDSGEGEGVQYIMVDYQLGFAGTTKYNAPTAFESRHGIDNGDVGVTVINPETGQPLYGAETQRGYESMRVRLYQHHGSAQEPSQFVTRFDEYFPDAGIATPPEGQPVEQFDTAEQAREEAQTDPNAIHGGVFGEPSERVEALQHFRLVHASEVGARSPFDRAFQQPTQPEPWVKTFERVDGATVEGTGPANTEVQASVEMEMGTTGETFVYNQFTETDEDGNWEMVVPYSTTGYDEYGTDAGYTDVDVRANDSYEFLAVESDDEDDVVGTPWSMSTEVTEGQVLGEDDTIVEVDLEEGRIPESVDTDGPDGEDEKPDDEEDDEETTDRQTTHSP